MVNLIGFEAFASYFPNIHPRTVERMALRGAFPKFIRMSPGTPALWDQAAVDKWLLAKLAPLTEGDD
jgi:hypothetical protein